MVDVQLPLRAPVIKSRSNQRVVIAHFDQLARTYTTRYEGPSALAYSFRVHMERVCDFFDQPGGRVLDVGCGAGVMVDWLRQQGCEVHGIDISAQMIAVCKERFHKMARLHFSVGAIEALPFRDNFFDAVICKGVLDFVEDDSLAIAELARVIRPRGTAILTLQHLPSPSRLWTYYIASRRQHDTLNRHAYRVQTSTRLLQSKGLTLQDFVYCNFQVFLKPFDRLLPRQAVWVAEKLERLQRNRLYGWMATGFVIKAIKGSLPQPSCLG